jgi:hypothetical protein
VFTESSEQSTENAHVEKSVITPVNMNTEGPALIGAFLCHTVFLEEDIPVFLSCVDLSIGVLDMNRFKKITSDARFRNNVI